MHILVHIQLHSLFYSAGGLWEMSESETRLFAKSGETTMWWSYVPLVRSRRRKRCFGTGGPSSPSTNPKEHWVHLQTSNPIESSLAGQTTDRYLEDVLSGQCPLLGVQAGGTAQWQLTSVEWWRKSHDSTVGGMCLQQVYATQGVRTNGSNGSLIEQRAGRKRTGVGDCIETWARFLKPK